MNTHRQNHLEGETEEAYVYLSNNPVSEVDALGLTQCTSMNACGENAGKSCCPPCEYDSLRRLLFSDLTTRTGLDESPPDVPVRSGRRVRLGGMNCAERWWGTLGKVTRFYVNDVESCSGFCTFRHELVHADMCESNPYDALPWNLYQVIGAPDPNAYAFFERPAYDASIACVRRMISTAEMMRDYYGSMDAACKCCEQSGVMDPGWEPCPR